MEFTETGWEDMCWVHMNLDGGQVVECCEYGDKPAGLIWCW